MGTGSCSKSNVKLSVSAKNLSRSLLPSIQQQSSVLQKHGRTQFNNSAVKATRTPTANKRSHSDIGKYYILIDNLLRYEANGGFGFMQV